MVHPGFAFALLPSKDEAEKGKAKTLGKAAKKGDRPRSRRRSSASLSNHVDDDDADHETECIGYASDSDEEPEVPGINDDDPEIIVLRAHVAEVKLKVGRRHLDFADALDALATCYYEKRNVAKAQEHYAHSLKIREAQLGLEHVKVASSFLGLGRALISTCEIDNGIPELYRCVVMRRKLLGSQHADTRLALFYLGVAHFRRLEFKEALEAFQKLDGANVRDDKEIVHVLCYLGCTMYALNKLNASLEYFERFMDAFTASKIHWDMHEGIGLMCVNYTAWLITQWEAEEALLIFRRLQPMMDTVFDGMRLFLFEYIYPAMGRVLLECNQYNEAIEILLECFSLRGDLGEGDDSGAIEPLLDMCAACLEVGKLDTALHYLQRAEKQGVGEDGRETQDMAYVHVMYSQYYLKKKGHNAKALKATNRANAILEARKESRPSTTIVLLKVGRNYIQQGKFSLAIPPLRRAFQIAHVSFGASNPISRDVAVSLMIAIEGAEDARKAIRKMFCYPSLSKLISEEMRSLLAIDPNKKPT